MTDPTDADVIISELGERGGLTLAHARDMALKFTLVWMHTRADATHILSVSGYDDDPREVWDIPEVKAFFAEFACVVWRGLRRSIREWRLDPPTLGVVAMCIDVAVCGPFDGKGYIIVLDRELEDRVYRRWAA